MARIATIDQARTPCPRSPHHNGAHEFRPVPPHIASRFSEPPLFFCVFDLLFLTERAVDEMGER